MTAWVKGVIVKNMPVFLFFAGQTVLALIWGGWLSAEVAGNARWIAANGASVIAGAAELEAIDNRLNRIELKLDRVIERRAAGFE